MNNRKITYTSKFLIATLIIIILLNGCSKQDGGEAVPSSPLPTVTTLIPPEPTSKPIAEPTIEPTIEPTLVSDTRVEFLKQNYESSGRSDVYHLPFNDFNYNFEVMAARFAGDYALFWVTRIGDDFSDGVQSGEYLILTKPAVSTEQYLIPLETYLSYIAVLEDGTVITVEWETNKVSVYDNKLNFIKAYSADQDAVSGDYTNDLSSLIDLIDIKDLKPQDFGLDSLNIINSDYTWFLYTPDNLLDMVVFPKSEAKEGLSFLQGKKLCTRSNQFINDTTFSQTFRVYDIENKTVAEGLKNTDIEDAMYLYPQGIVSDNVVIFYCNIGSTGDKIFLWDISDKSSDIMDFCDFSKQEPLGYLSDQLEDLKQNLGVVITPDKVAEDDESDFLEKIIYDIDFVNTFKVGKFSDPGVLVSKSGDYIHPENMRNNNGSMHAFNPHVFSNFYLKEHGEKAMESFFNYVDAVRAGEDSFECPDPNAVGWVSGRFATYFYPVLNNLTLTEYLGNGVAKIYYNEPKEEISEKIADFDLRICNILSDVIEDDYTDFEKALALYEFMTEYCTYDYEALYDDDSFWDQHQSGYRVLIEKKGICWEISCLYKYLLLQCGVDIEEAGGDPVNPNDQPHQWNYIILDGQAYLIDATWGLTDNRKPDLDYFLFTDEVRASRDGFAYESFDIADYKNNDMPEIYPYDANDNRYSELWQGTYLAFDQQEKCVFYFDIDNVIHRFDY